MIGTKSWLLASCAIIATAAAMPAFAQDDEPSLIEEVVVTAEKRAVSVQDVPVAVSAYTDTVRENVGIANVQDITNFTPGMTYTTGNDRVSLRGISRFTNNRSSEGGVAIYVDGAYTSSTTAGNLSTIFVDRTEVLRGPQGTLYGRNSVGGAVNFISKRPTDEFAGELRLGVGSYEKYTVEGSVSGPITDNLRYRFVGSWDDQREGYFENLSGDSEGGRGEQWVAEGQLEGDLLDGKLEWWAKAQFIEWRNFGRGPGGRLTYTTGEYETAYLVPSGQTPNPLYLYTGTRPANVDHFLIDVDDANYIALDSHNYTFESVFHANTFDIKLLSGYNQYRYRLQTDVDGTSRSAPFNVTINNPLATFGPTTVAVYPRRNAQYSENPWWYSNEINITSTGEGPNQWIFGLYNFREGSNYAGTDARMPDQAQAATPYATATGAYGAFGVPIYSLGSAPNPERIYAKYASDNVTWSSAVFGQWEHTFNEQWKVTAGLRHTWDRRKSLESARVFCFLGSACSTAFGTPGTYYMDITKIAYSNANTDPSIQIPVYYDAATGFAYRGLKNDWSATTGTLAVDWTPDEDTLVYGRYTRGYKAGGFNAGTIGASPTTEPEYINAYEIGTKKTFGARFQANASAFYYDYTDVQVPLSEINVATGASVTNFYNLPKTTSMGFELETIWYPTDRLQILANYAYLDAEIDEACCFSDPDDPTGRQPGADVVGRTADPDGAGPREGNAAQDLAGQKFPNSIPHRVTVNANYTWDLMGGSLVASASYIWRDGAYASQFNRWYNEFDAWGQADARIVWRDADDKFTIIGFVRNVFDEEGPVSAGGTRRNLPHPAAGSPYEIYARNYTLNQPRTMGIELQRRF